MRKKSLEEVKNDIYNKRKYKVLSTEYKGVHEKLKIQCDKGHITNASYHGIMSDNYICKECRKENNLDNVKNLTLEDIQKYVNEVAKDYKVLNTYIENGRRYLIIQCDKGHQPYRVLWSNFRKNRRCPYCSNNNILHTYNYIKSYIEDREYKLLSNKYKGNRNKLLLECPMHHQYLVAFSHFQRGDRCPICQRENSKGKNHWNWKGGITPLEKSIREYLSEWKFNSLKYYNFKCVLSGKHKNLEVHHLLSFNTILQGVLKKLNLTGHNNINNYSKKELNKIIKLVKEEHNKMFGVPLTKELHFLFHKLYGKGNNTPEQFEEFEKRYKLGEFNIIQEEVS